jgi:CHASE3 domain sensor protein
MRVWKYIFKKQDAILRIAVVLLFLLAFVLFYFADKSSDNYKRLYEKQTGIKVT